MMNKMNKAFNQKISQQGVTKDPNQAVNDAKVEEKRKAT